MPPLKKVILWGIAFVTVAFIGYFVFGVLQEMRTLDRFRDAKKAMNLEQDNLEARIEAGLEKSYFDLELGDFNQELASEIGISKGESYTDIQQKVWNFQYPGEPMQMHAGKWKMMPKSEESGTNYYYFYSAYNLINDRTDRNEILVIVSPRELRAKAVGIRFKCFDRGKDYRWSLQPC